MNIMLSKKCVCRSFQTKKKRMRSMKSGFWPLLDILTLSLIKRPSLTMHLNLYGKPINYVKLYKYRDGVCGFRRSLLVNL